MAFFLLRYMNVYFTLTCYTMVALIGILLAQNDFFERYIHKYKNSNISRKITSSMINFGVLGICFFLRGNIEECWDILEALIVVLMCMIVCTLINRIPILSKIMEFIGKHSMNMFLIHTFIYYFWFREFVYSFRWPVLIVLVLLIITLFISVILELLKKALSYNKLVDMVCNKVWGVVGIENE